MRGSRAESEFRRFWLRAGGTDDSLPPLSGMVSNDTEDVFVGLLTPMCPGPSDWRHEEFLRWAGLPIQDIGVLGFHGSQVNKSWLRKSLGFRERH